LEAFFERDLEAFERDLLFERDGDLLFLFERERDLFLAEERSRDFLVDERSRDLFLVEDRSRDEAFFFAEERSREAEDFFCFLDRSGDEEAFFLSLLDDARRSGCCSGEDFFLPPEASGDPLFARSWDSFLEREDDLLAWSSTKSFLARSGEAEPLLPARGELLDLDRAIGLDTPGK